MGSHSIRDELLELGTLGRSAYTLLVRTFAQELKRFPSLLDLESAEDFALEFFADRASAYPQALATTSDDDAAARLTHRWARNWLVDKARSFPLGALRNRLEKRLDRSALFERSQVAHYWRLADGNDVDTGATRPELQSIAARASVHIDLAKRESDSSPRLGRTGELEQLLIELLTRSGRLHIAEITSICAERFPTLLESGDVLLQAYDLDEDEDTNPVLGQADIALEDVGATDLNLAARELLSRLPDRLRTTLLHIDDVKAVAEELGVGRSAAYNAIADAKARLVELAGDADNAPKLLQRLIELIMDESANVSSDSGEQLSEGVQ